MQGQCCSNRAASLMPLLEVNALTAFYGDFQALYGVSMAVEADHVVAVIGANGAGKSTLLNTIAGLIRRGAGMIVFDGEPIGGMRAAQLVAQASPSSRKAAGFSLAQRRGEPDHRQPGSAARAIGRSQRIYELFPVLRERRNHRSMSLSGGQQQMVAIGRALMSNPRLLLCDELSLGLAPIVVREIYQRLPSIVAEGTAWSSSSRTSCRPLAVVDPALLPPGRPGVAGRQFGVARPRRHPRRLFRDVNRPVDWINTIVQGVLLGGLYALFAAGLSLIFGVMRLVNIAHGDLIVRRRPIMAYFVMQILGIGPFTALIVVVPAMARPRLSSCSAASSTSPSAATSCRRSSSPSACRSSSRTCSSCSSPPTSGGCRPARSRSRAGRRATDLAIGVLPVMQFAAAVAIIGGLQFLFYRTGFGRAFRATSDDQTVAQLMGLETRHIFALAMAMSLAVVAVAGVFICHPHQFRSLLRPAAADLRLRGDHHRRTRQPVGDARRRHPARRRPGGRRAHLCRPALPRRPRRLPAVLLVRPQGLFPRV